jgi:tyrosine aminotransferase
VQAVQHSDGYAASYVDACGTVAARQAIAHFHSHQAKTGSVTVKDDYIKDGTTADNVIIASGCSGALEIVITSLLDDVNLASKTVLFVPQPGFPLYQVIAESHGGLVHHYPLLPNNGWEIDIDNLRNAMFEYSTLSQTDGNGPLRMILLINNPSNPTGAVFSKQHLTDIVNLCEEYKVCIVADEVYGHIVFEPSNKFYPVAHVVTESVSNVPVITVSGLAKQFLLPGWRLGWIVFQDK